MCIYNTIITAIATITMNILQPFLLADIVDAHIVPLLYSAVDYYKAIMCEDLYSARIMEKQNKQLYNEEWYKCWIHVAKDGTFNAIKWLYENKPRYYTCDVMFRLHINDRNVIEKWLQHKLDYAKMIKYTVQRDPSISSDQLSNFSSLECNHKWHCMYYRHYRHSGGIFSLIAGDGKSDRIIVDVSPQMKEKEEGKLCRKAEDKYIAQLLMKENNNKVKWLCKKGTKGLHHKNHR